VAFLTFKIFSGANRKYFFHTFYIEQRKMLNVLVDDNLKPIGGKWSFDAENRKKAPKGLVFNEPIRLTSSKEKQEAIDYVDTHFDTHPGEVDLFHYPTTHAEARRWLGGLPCKQAQELWRL
jgi:deoxyribodipyrimidine photolyase-related protein